jgi:hypothetical protein
MRLTFVCVYRSQSIPFHLLDPYSTFNKMKITIVSLVALMASSASAFAPSAAFTRGVSTQLFTAEPEEEEGLDLNLEDMFDM